MLGHWIARTQPRISSWRFSNTMHIISLLVRQKIPCYPDAGIACIAKVNCALRSQHIVISVLSCSTIYGWYNTWLQSYSDRTKKPLSASSISATLLSIMQAP